jgi:uncharacterized Ntn-hydrolase superfamily protein
MTFSIVAIDKLKKELGFAISSCSFNSSLVCQTEVETGVIASQAQGNLAFLPLFFEKLTEARCARRRETISGCIASIC